MVELKQNTDSTKVMGQLKCNRIRSAGCGSNTIPAD